MKWRAANEARAPRTNAAARTIRSLVRHADDGHFPPVSNRHLAIRNRAIPLKHGSELFLIDTVAGGFSPTENPLGGAFSARLSK